MAACGIAPKRRECQSPQKPTSGKNDAPAITAGLMVFCHKSYTSLDPYYAWREQLADLVHNVSTQGLNSAVIFVPDGGLDAVQFWRRYVKTSILQAAGLLSLEHTVMKHPKRVRGTITLRCTPLTGRGDGGREPSHFVASPRALDDSFISSSTPFRNSTVETLRSPTNCHPRYPSENVQEELPMLRMVHVSVLSLATSREGTGDVFDVLESNGSAEARVIVETGVDSAHGGDAAFANIALQDINFFRVGAVSDIEETLSQIEEDVVRNRHLVISLVVEAAAPAAAPENPDALSLSRISRLTFVMLETNTGASCLRATLDDVLRPDTTTRGSTLLGESAKAYVPFQTSSVPFRRHPLPAMLADLVGGATRCMVGIFPSPGREYTPELLHLVEQCRRVKNVWQFSTFSSHGRLANLLGRWDRAITALASGPPPPGLWGAERLRLRQKARRRLELILATVGHRASEATKLADELVEKLGNMRLQEALTAARRLLVEVMPAASVLPQLDAAIPRPHPDWPGFPPVDPAAAVSEQLSATSVRGQDAAPPAAFAPYGQPSLKSSLPIGEGALMSATSLTPPERSCSASSQSIEELHPPPFRFDRQQSNDIGATEDGGGILPLSSASTASTRPRASRLSSQYRVSSAAADRRLGDFPMPPRQLETNAAAASTPTARRPRPDDNDDDSNTDPVERRRQELRASLGATAARGRSPSMPSLVKSPMLLSQPPRLNGFYPTKSVTVDGAFTKQKGAIILPETTPASSCSQRPAQEQHFTTAPSLALRITSASLAPAAPTLRPSLTAPPAQTPSSPRNHPIGPGGTSDAPPNRARLRPTWALMDAPQQCPKLTDLVVRRETSHRGSSQGQLKVPPVAPLTEPRPRVRC